jgi:cellulose synthase/poly-beta-1,6-N-acetylglucosamine synthase-like glycosyltransferase
MPKIGASIIIPCYDTATYISEAIDSAYSQGSLATEVIVIDDGSTDGSWEELARLKRQRWAEGKLQRFFHYGPGLVSHRLGLGLIFPMNR